MATQEYSEGRCGIQREQMKCGELKILLEPSCKPKHVLTLCSARGRSRQQLDCTTAQITLNSSRSARWQCVRARLWCLHHTDTLVLRDAPGCLNEESWILECQPFPSNSRARSYASVLGAPTHGSSSAIWKYHDFCSRAGGTTRLFP